MLTNNGFVQIPQFVQNMKFVNIHGGVLGFQQSFSGELYACDPISKSNPNTIEATKKRHRPLAGRLLLSNKWQWDAQECHRNR